MANVLAIRACERAIEATDDSISLAREGRLDEAQETAREAERHIRSALAKWAEGVAAPARGGER